MKRSVFLACFFVAAFALSAQPRRVAVLAVNDMHAALTQMPKLKFLADSLRGEYPDLLLLSAGDNTTGNPCNDRSREHPTPMTYLMNRLLFDASALGNHEFDRGVDHLVEEMRVASFPYIVSNLPMLGFAPDSLEMLAKECYSRLFRRSYYGYRIALIGLTVDALPAEEAFASMLIKRIRAKNDLVILLSHAGFETDTLVARQYAGQIDLIVGGHNHLNLPHGWQRDSTALVVQNDDCLRHATLVVFRKTADGWQHTLQQFALDRFPSDKPFADYVAALDRDLGFEQVVACLDQTMTGKRQLGEMECKSFLQATQADVALLNIGAIRVDSLLSGRQTLGDILQVDPFDDEVVTVDIDSSQLPKLVASCQRSDRGREPVVVGQTVGKGKISLVTTSYVADYLRAYGLDFKPTGMRNQTLLADYFARLFPCR